VQVHNVAGAFTSHSKLDNYAELKPLSCVKLAYFHFSSSNFAVQVHILSTSGDAFNPPKWNNFFLQNDSGILG
jgi:hypothetical protein